MSLYSRLAATADKQIKDKGRDVTLRSVDEGSYDPQADSFTGQSNTDTIIKAVITNFQKDEVDGQLVLQGDKRALMTTLPAINDKIIDGSTHYRVVSVEDIDPGTQAVLYKVQLRR